MRSQLPETESIDGATVVISHRVHHDKHMAYEQWLDKIGPISRASAGFLDWHIVRPIAGRSETFRVILRFETEAHLNAWMGSEQRAHLIAEVQPLLLAGDDFFVSSGLDFWFAPTGAQAQIPVRWKQYLVTWSAIYPLALGVPLAVVPVLDTLGVPRHPLLTTLAVTGVVVFLMVYVVMPRYTRLIHHWLFK